MMIQVMMMMKGMDLMMNAQIVPWCFFNITRELSRNSQNISKRVVGWILIFLSL